MKYQAELRIIATLAAASAVTAEPAGADAETPGFVNVVSTPSGVEVTLDGDSIGTTPLRRFAVTPGPHVVRLGGTCHVARNRKVEVTEGHTKSVAFITEPLTTLLTITAEGQDGDRASGTVWIDGVRVGRTQDSFRAPACSTVVHVADASGNAWSKRITSPWREARVGLSAKLVAPSVFVWTVHDDTDACCPSPATDTVSRLDPDGRTVLSKPAFAICGTTGSSPLLAPDPTDGSVWGASSCGDSKAIVHLNEHGDELARIDDVDATGLALDVDGTVVVAHGGGTIASARLSRIGRDGKLHSVTTRGIGSVGLAISRVDRSIWTCGGTVVSKTAPDGRPLVIRRDLIGWNCAAIAVDDRDGAVWVAERSHSQVRRSKNTLWKLASTGEPTVTIPMGEVEPFALAVDPTTGDVWVTAGKTIPTQSLLRFDRNGAKNLVVPRTSFVGMAVDPITRSVWGVGAAGLTEVRIDGKVGRRRSEPSAQFTGAVAMSATPLLLVERKK